MTTNRRVCPPVRAVLASTLTVALSAAPALALWEAADGEIFLTMDASIAADSNIGSNALEQSDTIFSVTPGFSWERSRGRGSISLGAQCEIERASEYEVYDSENYSADFSLDMPVTPAGRLHGGINARYFDGSRVNAFQGTRVSESSYDLGFNGAYQVTNKINARAAANYGNTDPEEIAGYENTSFNLGAGYNFRPDVSFFADVRITDSSSDETGVIVSGTDTSGHAVLIGLDGQITQKLTGRIGVGYDWSETEYGLIRADYDGFTYDVSLTWTPRERTSIALSASSGVQSTSTGGTEYVTWNGRLTQEIGLNMTGDVGVSYRSSDYALAGRGGDDLWEGTFGLRYAFTREISVRGSYTYTSSESPTVLTDYTRSIWRLTASARF